MEQFEYTQENLRRMQLIEADMLKELDRICRLHEITYIIDAGTLLGAVRHGGFIPWDDDIDVRMLRAEYEKFVEACKASLDHEKYFLQSHETDPGYRWGYTRILRKDTVFIRKGQRSSKARNGIFIDIFPCDSLPEAFLARKKYTILSWISRKALYSEIGAKNKKHFFSYVGFNFLNLFPKAWAHGLQSHLIAQGKKKRTEDVRCLGWGSAEETLGFKREWLEETTDIQFEGLTVKAPVKTHEFLVHSFGEDYMTPPPVEEREPRHTAEYIKFI